ncbi:cyclic nucleotide-binding domain-containing protein [Oceanicoccus sagamiensis]|uniref:Cyclic nucleotide-binding protein n=1 Tax=Oceanicoccus sagamiensis TaxID=716816 RepID=A0A1X9NKV1_9GAMM|nr:cyclic nucleotide-binding domain-containing protein [Oceanicoccus sagamiensis]ARN74583.1 cyclic nucleotide-binding protein [Oceanicoccus sagamiensis]
MSNRFHIAVVGSGPAGLSAAGRAAFYDKQKREADPSHDYTHVLLESFEKPAKTIQRYQKGKHVMAEPGFLDLRSDFDFAAGSRETILGGWEQRVDDSDVNIRYNTEVTKIEGQKGDFALTLKDGSVIHADYVILAIGLEGNPRKLGVPGEDFPLVQYTLDDPTAHSDETVVVVGAGDSAIENALGLVKQNKVAILNRRDEFSRAKEGNLNAILAANADASVPLTCYYSTSVKHITQTEEGGYEITLNTSEGEESFACDRVIARLGGVPPRGFVESIGVEFPNKKPDAIPELTGKYESNVEGLYIIGSLAGYPLIKQAMNQGYDVVEYILGHDIKPADHPLLELQFNLLPYLKDVDDLVTLFQQRIPMFREMNALQFRELVIESDILVSYEDGPMLEDVQSKAKALEEKLAQRDPRPRFTKIIRAGDAIYRDGDFTNSFFTIVEGEVKVDMPGIAKPMTYTRGQFFGEASLLSGRPREGNAIAGKDCIIVETPRRTMVKLMNSNDEVRDGIDLIFIVRALQKHVAPQLSVAKLSEFAASAELRTYKAGEVLFKQGEVGDSLHIIRRGSVSLLRETNGEKIVVAQHQSGKIVGEMSLMGDPIRRETATAAVLTETIELDRKSFMRLVKADTSRIEVLQSNASERAVTHTTMEARPEVGSVMQFLMDEGLGEATNCLVIAEDLCVGCDNCEKACAETHNGISRLDRKSGASYGELHIPVSCRHCEQPHCMKDCPPNAIHRASSGEVFIDNNCIGCGNCESNCPYDVIKLAYDAPKKPGFWSWLLFGSGSGPGEELGYSPDEVAKKKGKKAVKCDACMSQPSGPACVNSCPTGAAARLSPEQFLQLVEKR